MQQTNKVIYLQDAHCYKKFYPFTHTIHTGQMLSGRYTMQQRWAAVMGCEVHCIRNNSTPDGITIFSADDYPANYHLPTLNNTYQIVALNAKIIALDVAKVKTTVSHPFPKNCNIIGTNIVHIGNNVIANYCIFNTTNGPIIIEDDVVIMEAAILKGPLVIKRNAVIKACAQIYGGTTIGKKCTIGGEVKNAILLYASNKAHHGYLGDSYIGAWCNLGAGTSNSNVKNTGGTINYYSEYLGHVEAISNKAGILMGHYSRTAINTALNSGTVIGVSANVFGVGLTPKFIDHFTWGYDHFSPYTFTEAIAHINNWMAFKNEQLPAETEELLQKLFKKLIRPA